MCIFFEEGIIEGQMGVQKQQKLSLALDNLDVLCAGHDAGLLSHVLTRPEQ